jgi:hypothetical protein
MKIFIQKIAKIALLFTIFFSQFTAYSQAPQKMSYQMVVRNTNNALITNAPVGMYLSILQGSPSGVVFYVETHIPVTNSNGLATIEIGNGTPLWSTFSSINWASGPYFIKTEIDPNGGSNYTITSTSQLASVPFAMYANNSGDNKWTSNGTTISNNNDGNVGIGTNNPLEKLEVAGKTRTTDLQVTTGAGAGKILTSDASGNATWQTPAVAPTTGTIAGVYPFNGAAGPGPYTASDYVFVGPTTTFTITSSTQKVYGTAIAPLALAAGSPKIDVLYGLGFRLGVTGAITNFVGNAYTVIELTDVRNPQTATGYVTNLIPGIYTMGVILSNDSGTAISNNDYVNGWIMVIN